jgi:hypothetical protein
LASERRQLRRRSWDCLSESESPRHTLQTKTKAMAAQMHNPTPAIAQDTPTYAKVTINATQASTRRTLIGHLYRRRIRAGMIQLPWIVQGQTGILRVLGKRQSRERATDAVMS